MSNAVAIFFILSVLAGCQSIGRYGDSAPPGESAPAPRRFQSASTEVRVLPIREMIRLGLIAQKYLGKPSPQSSNGGGGIDCSEFTRRVFDDYGSVTLPRTAAEQFALGSEVARSELAFGDLVFFAESDRQIFHVGISVGFNQFIHSSSSRGVIVSSLSESYWHKRFAGARRLIPPAQ